MKKYVFLILSLLTVCFIWHNSMADAPHSSRTSLYVLHLIQNYFAGVSEVEHLTNGILRKMAHVTEYALLGIALCGLFSCLRRKYKIFITAVMAFFIAAVDESIQMFSPGRSAEFHDVLLDTSGAVLGAVMSVLLLWCMGKIREH